MMPDRRIGERISTSVPVGFSLPKGRPSIGWGRIIDIGPTGLLLETRVKLKVSEVIYVSFILRQGTSFENLRARVIRTSAEEGYTQAGIAFDEVVDPGTMKDVLSAITYEAGLIK